MHSGVQHFQRRLCIVFTPRPFTPSAEEQLQFETKWGYSIYHRPAANINTGVSPFLYIPQTSEKIWHEHAQGMDQ